MKIGVIGSILGLWIAISPAEGADKVCFELPENVWTSGFAAPYVAHWCSEYNRTIYS